MLKMPNILMKLSMSMLLGLTKVNITVSTFYHQKARNKTF